MVAVARVENIGLGARLSIWAGLPRAIAYVGPRNGRVTRRRLTRRCGRWRTVNELEESEKLSLPWIAYGRGCSCGAIARWASGTGVVRPLHQWWS